MSTTSAAETTTLGTTDLEVSRVAFGTWQLGGDSGGFDEDEAIRAIRYARALGVHFFDTAQADGFGASERLGGAHLLVGRFLDADASLTRARVLRSTDPVGGVDQAAR